MYYTTGTNHKWSYPVHRNCETRFHKPSGNTGAMRMRYVYSYITSEQRLPNSWVTFSHHTCSSLKHRYLMFLLLLRIQCKKPTQNWPFASPNTFSGSVVRTLRGLEQLTNMFRLVASSLRHIRSQRSMVGDTNLQRIHNGCAKGLRGWAWAFSCGVFLAQSLQG